jgi:hypothetical protein
MKRRAGWASAEHTIFGKDEVPRERVEPPTVDMNRHIHRARCLRESSWKFEWQRRICAETEVELQRAKVGCAENGVVQKMGCVEIGLCRNWSCAKLEWRRN